MQGGHTPRKCREATLSGLAPPQALRLREGLSILAARLSLLSSGRISFFLSFSLQAWQARRPSQIDGSGAINGSVQGVHLAHVPG